MTLARIMLPFLPTVAIAAAAMGMLNARGRFGIPAVAPAMLNVGMVAGGLALIPVMRAWGYPPIVAMAVGVLIGGLAQFAIQIPSLHAEGFRFRLERPRLHPGVLRVAMLMGPAAVGLAATQINLGAAAAEAVAKAGTRAALGWVLAPRLCLGGKPRRCTRSSADRALAPPEECRSGVCTDWAGG